MHNTRYINSFEILNEEVQWNLNDNLEEIQHHFWVCGTGGECHGCQLDCFLACPNLPLSECYGAALSRSGEAVGHSQAQFITVPRCNAVHQLCTCVRNGSLLIMCMFTITPHSHASYLGHPRFKSWLWWLKFLCFVISNASLHWGSWDLATSALTSFPFIVSHTFTQNYLVWARGAQVPGARSLWQLNVVQ